MNDLEKAILCNTGATESSTFSELLRGMGEGDEAPGNGPTTWAEFFKALKGLERNGYLEIDRGPDDKIDSLILTSDGIALVRSF